MADIFISYAREDLERVRPIVKELEKRDWSVFWDRTIPPGKKYQDVITDALEAARCVLVVWTQYSITSDWVWDEANDAKARDILVPLSLDAVKIPLGFRSYHTVDLSDWHHTSAHQGFEQIMGSIETNIFSALQSNHELSVTPEVTVVPPLSARVPPNFVFIRGGEFTMGSPSYEPERQIGETQHQVSVSDFYMGKFTVTQAEWCSVTGTNPSTFQGDNLPVECVSWDDCQAFIQALNRKTGKTYRLPTEAEWEYACRSGTITPFNTGGNLTTDEANYDGNDPYNKNLKGQYRKKTVAVDSFGPNACGLYNMHGNVWEWCSDWYDSNYYAICKAKGVVTNPENTSPGSGRVLRGGSWFSFARHCRSAYRFILTPDYRSYFTGFRLAFVP
ncbi:MAG: SUMF1/EgtB/PvdO family nonheme iron enzyme [Desulfuromonadales bacterium]